MDVPKIFRDKGYITLTIIIIIITIILVSLLIIQHNKYRDVVAGYDITAWSMLQIESGNLIGSMEKNELSKDLYEQKLANLQNISEFIWRSPNIGFMEFYLDDLIRDLKYLEGESYKKRFNDFKKLHEEMVRLSMELQGEGINLDNYFKNEKNRQTFENKFLKLD